MTENNVLHAHFREHIRRNFARERAALLEVAVLRADFDVRALGCGKSGFKVGERNASYDFHALYVGNQRLEFLKKRLCLGTSFVHLPVARDNRFSYRFVHNKTSFLIAFYANITC